MSANNAYDKWITGSYQYFSETGPEKFSIKELSQKLGLSRTSFHYYFENKEDFFDHLIDHHLDEVIRFGKLAVKNTQNTTQSIMKAMEELSTGMKFHVQLFIHRKNPKFDKAYLKGHEINFNNGILDWFLDQFELKMTREAGKKAYLIFADVLNSRLSYMMLTPDKHKDTSFSSVFIELITDFKILLTAYKPNK